MPKTNRKTRTRKSITPKITHSPTVRHTISKTAEPSACETPSSLRNKYRFIKEIGHGAQGKIFLAIRVFDNLKVVIKQLNISSIKTWKEYELFQRESNVLQNLNIPGVAKFYEGLECLDDDPPCSYIVQEYIEGASLQKIIDDGHRFQISCVYDIIIQILNILNALHHNVPPIIHRDIKPSNIMLTPEETGNYKVTLIDFGAVANPQLQGGGSTVAGTYGYMPPEQLTGNPGPQSDIYALAAMTVQLFTNKSPACLPTKDFRLIFEPEMQDQPHELISTLRKMLEPDVKHRLSDISVLEERFNAFRLNQFHAYLEHKLDYQDTDYSNQLESVNFIGEEGNLDLWQRLPENTPRRIPECYSNRLNQDTILPEPFPHTKDLSTVRPLLIRLCVILSVPIFFILSSCLFLAFGSHASANQNSFAMELAVIPSAIWIVITCLCYKFLEIDSHTQEIRFTLDKKSIFHSDNKQYDKYSSDLSISELIRSGRKSIATITNINFLTLKKEHTFIRIESKSNPKVIPFIYYARPCFEVKYRFNPPDDYRSEDIIHSFITHCEPEGHYKVGDPLPILYTIERRYFNDIITSMPYPMPITDMSNLRDVIAHSIGERKNF